LQLFFQHCACRFEAALQVICANHLAVGAVTLNVSGAEDRLVGRVGAEMFRFGTEMFRVGAEVSSVGTEVLRVGAEMFWVRAEVLMVRAEVFSVVVPRVGAVKLIVWVERLMIGAGEFINWAEGHAVGKKRFLVRVEKIMVREVGLMVGEREL